MAFGVVLVAGAATSTAGSTASFGDATLTVFFTGCSLEATVSAHDRTGENKAGVFASAGLSPESILDVIGDCDINDDGNAVLGDDDEDVDDGDANAGDGLLLAAAAAAAFARSLA